MIRAGIIGCGDVAQRAYVPGFQELASRIEVVATFDTVADRAELVAGTFSDATAYTSMDDFLGHAGGDGMDVVFNLTPAPLHRDITAQVLEAGFHVYSEKPIAATVQHARELVEIANAQGRTLFCAPATLVTGRFKWIKSVLTGGNLGRSIAIKAHIGGMGPAAWMDYVGDPRVFYGEGVGPLIDTGVYMLHVMTGLLGPAKRVQAVGGITIPEREIKVPRYAGEIIQVSTPDLYSINMDFGDETYGNLYSSFAIPRSKAPFFELFAEKGTISVDAAAWYNGNGPSDVFRIEGGTGGWENNVAVPEPVETDGILESGILHMIEHLENDVPLVLTAEHATHVLEIMVAARASIENSTGIALETTF